MDEQIINDNKSFIYATLVHDEQIINKSFIYMVIYKNIIRFADDSYVLKGTLFYHQV